MLFCFSQKVESLNKEIMILKDERDHALENFKESKKRESISRLEITSMTEQCRSQEIKIQKLSADHKKELVILEKSQKVILSN